jgi:hypothetical protein
MPNRLAAEQSPYLLQHAHNPVDWYPWGPDAFDTAARLDRPIFLSVGYATCHWCHVMERESFEDPDIASVLNAHFVSIKVDREERPDVDRVYMLFVQATTGSGGWPMSVWLTPDLKPFYGGTYFPPASQWGRPAFRDVLLEIARAWREEREHVARSASAIVSRLAVLGQGQNERRTPDAGALAMTAHQFRQAFDARRGGFGDAPKFPRPSELFFLLRESARTGDRAGREMTEQTLRAMALGGLRDHIGGGFHRYSVDAAWRVPHFEKMLYDQAQLALAYLEAAQATADLFFAQVADDTLQYVERDMTDPAGGFQSAEDADSLAPTDGSSGEAPHKREGAFYVWGVDEVRTALGNDSAVFERRFGLLPSGNAPFDPQHEFTDRNLLYTARSIADLARDHDKSSGEVAEILMRARRTLFDVRERRSRPERDDKVLTAWNGLAIAALARASRVLDAVGLDEALGGTCAGRRHLASAERAAGFVRATMWDGTSGRLLRRYRRGAAEIDGYAEDYACLIFGLIELFQATGEPAWLAWARELQSRLDERFGDPVDGGWFSTTGADPSVLLRMKEDHDGAEPSPTSVSAWNLLTLAHLTGQAAYAERARQAIQCFGARLIDQGRAVPMMAAALEIALAPPEQIVVVGPRDDEGTQTMWRAANRRYRPFAVFVPVDPRRQAALAGAMPWVASMRMIDGKATAYVCRKFACDAPSTDPAVFDN